jgi:hypothetical protein
LLDQADDAAAWIVSDIGETLVSNRLGTLLLGDHSAYTGLARIEAYRWFTDSGPRVMSRPTITLRTAGCWSRSAVGRRRRGQFARGRAN